MQMMRNDIPANTSFPPVSHHTTKATIAAGKMKIKTLAIKIITIIPIINKRINATSPVKPYDPINKVEIITNILFFINKYIYLIYIANRNIP